MSGTSESEVRRLAALRDMVVLDTAPEPAFDRLARLASRLLETPIALVSLIDAERQWFKARVGLDTAETPREHAFCEHAIGDGAFLEVPDATRDARFVDNPLVQGPPHIRFYAGAPLRTEAGCLGTLCVIDRRPRELSASQREVLQELADAVVDALEQRKARIQAAQRLELLELAEQLADVGHWRLRVEDRHVFWSPQIYRIFGVDPERYVPNYEAAIAAYHPDDGARVQALVEAAVERRAPFEFEARLVRPGGEVRHVRSIGRPEVPSEAGEVLSVFGVFQDITAQKQMQDRLSQAEKLASLGTLAAGVAHEINNPLTYVQTNAGELVKRMEVAGLGDEALEMARDVLDGAERIAAIVEGLRTFSRASEERLEPVELKRVVDIATRLSAHEIERHAELEVAVAEDTPVVLGDESRLVQVVVNLLVNAAQAITEVETLRFVGLRAGRTEAGDAFLEVVDSGEGMSEAVQRQALTPFFTTKPRGVGTGLGLPICHGIVRSFGGEMTFQSEPGVGTSVRIVLPAAGEGARVGLTGSSPRGPEPASASEPEAPAAGSGDEAGDPSAEPAPSGRDPQGRILVVDDDRLVGLSLARALGAHAVVVERGARAAIERLEAGERFDVILCDLVMPGMGGRDLHAALAERFPEQAARMVIMTGGVFTEEAAAFLGGVGERVLEKPIEPERLHALIAPFLRAAAPARPERGAQRGRKARFIAKS